jgi:predicted O-methyltransferase YrrM
MMFRDIPEALTLRMAELEETDIRDRVDGTQHLRRLRQIPPDTGRFLALLAASAPDGDWIEIGTSAGYSTMWLSLACRARGRVLTTYEILEEKAQLAIQTIATAMIGDVVRLVHGDFLAHADSLKSVGFCFLDAEKDIYDRCYEAVVPHLVPGGLLIADNALSHGADLQPMINKAMADERVDALVVPIGTGELICRRC